MVNKRKWAGFRGMKLKPYTNEKGKKEQKYLPDSKIFRNFASI